MIFQCFATISKCLCCKSSKATKVLCWKSIPSISIQSSLSPKSNMWNYKLIESPALEILSIQAGCLLRRAFDGLYPNVSSTVENLPLFKSVSQGFEFKLALLNIWSLLSECIGRCFVQKKNSGESDFECDQAKILNIILRNLHHMDMIIDYENLK